MEADFDLAWRALMPDMPEPEHEHKFATARKWHFDRAWVAQRVAVEVDGGQWVKNGGRHNRDADRVKLNEAAGMGWLVFRFSHEMLSVNPTLCCEQVKRALTERFCGAIE